MTERCAPFPQLVTIIKGAPLCYDLPYERIAEYVENRRSVAYQRYIDNDPNMQTRDRSFNDVVDNLLLRCLRDVTAYTPANDETGQIKFSFASFHCRTCPDVPLTDVYGALGWFISYAEDPATTVDTNRKLLVCYTRLCRIIGKKFYDSHRGRIPLRAREDFEGYYLPAMTHMLTIGSYPFTTTDAGSTVGELKWKTAFGASLPWVFKGNKKKSGYSEVCVAESPSFTD
ncbi:hypothetical protein ACEPAI_4497 [Sanghuangporus weigelae]